MTVRTQSALLDVLKQTRPFSSLQEELYLSVLRTASELSHATDQLLRAHGTTQPQYNVLRILLGAGAEGLGRNEIAERMVTSTPDMSRLLDRMESAGHIQRERSQQDRRQWSTTLTSNGTTLVTNLEKPMRELHLTRFQSLSSKEMKVLLTLLTRSRH